VVSPGTFTPAKDSRFYKEADLKGHLENNKEADNAKTEEHKDEMQRILAKDYQLQQALIMLKGMKVLAVKNPPVVAAPPPNAAHENEVTTEPAGS
jgi:hypothetical protein